jgi:transposase-like protein
MEQRPTCPECGHTMGKAGKRWSGRKKKQIWLCSNCGRTVTGDIPRPQE